MEESKTNKSVFDTLNVINVNEHTEKKNGLTYLSWAWAWAEVKKRYPNTQYKVYERDDGCIYWTDGKTAWVKTSVTIEGLEYVEYLPVMDYKNQSIPVDKITSFDVNKAIQRSLTKNLGRHGLGLYIYSGEDLPEEEKATDKQVELLESYFCGPGKKFYPALCEKYKINKLNELSKKNASEIIEGIKKMQENRQGETA